jgi:hypothetical protein
VKADHPLAQNLFDRLSRYTPSEGEKRKREPLEDFITESLAYLLLASAEFRKGFLSNILSLPETNAAVFIATQSVDNGFDGRADMVIITSIPGHECIGIEVKRYAKFQKEEDGKFQRHQLDRLKAGFADNAFLLAPESYLRKERATIDSAKVAEASLEDVHQLCSKVAEVEPEPLKSLFRQFAEFLESKGHARVKITHHPMKTQFLPDCAKLMDDWTRFLYKIRADLGIDRSPNQKAPKWEEDQKKWPDVSFYGVYGSGESYIGFKINHKDGIDCFYQETRFLGDPHIPLLDQMERGDQGRVYYSLTAPYPSPESGDQSAELTRIFKDLQAKVRQAFSELEKPA